MDPAVLALSLTLALGGPSSAHVEIRGDPPPFVLEPGFFEAVPETTIEIVIDDARPTDELVVDVVRIGPKGKGKTKVSVDTGLVTRILIVTATTDDEKRAVGRAFASLPIRQRVPLPTGSARIRIRVDSPCALQVTVGEGSATSEIPLVPLAAEEPAPPLLPVPAPVPAPTTTTTTPPPPPPAPPPAPTTTTPTVIEPAPAPATITTTIDEEPAPAPVTTSFLPRLYAEVRAGGAAYASGLQLVVPAGGVRILAGPRDLGAVFGLALDFDGQGAFVDAGRWDAATTRLRLEALFDVGQLNLLDAELGVAVGLGPRLTWHSANLAAVRKTVLVVGGTARVAPEAAFPAGPGRFAISLPVDVGVDLPSDVGGFAPLAVGLLLGYRLEL